MKNKILIIPDVHGRQFWRQAVASGKYSKIIFLGDYVDPYPYEHIDGPTAMHGLVDIIAFRDSHPDQVVLLLGNHDMHYFSLHYHDVCLSDRYDYRQAETLHRLYTEGHRFKLAHEETLGGKHYLFSHAGVTMTWLKQNSGIIVKPDAAHLNHPLDTNKGMDTLAQVGAARWGIYPSGSMVWADIEELLESNPLPDTYQIVGHTMQMEGPIITDKVACLDCRAGFSLDQEGEILPVTEVIPYEVIW
jgi:predicted phosphodiesterase